MFTSFTDFLKWEKATEDTIDVKKVYIDMAEDVMGGIMLSQIVYWYLPSKVTGKQKLKVKKLCKKTKKDHFWIAKARSQWFEEIRFSKDNVITAMKKLEKKQIIFRQDNMFDGVKTAHIRLNIPVFLKMLNKYVTDNAEDIPVEEADFYAYLDEEMANLPEADSGSALQPQGLSGIQTTQRQESRQPNVRDTDNQSSGIQTPITEITSETSSQTTFENQNLNLSEQLFTMKLPMPLKKFFSKQVSVLVNDSFDIDIVEEFYNTSEYIKPDCTREDFNWINDFEYTIIIKKMFEEVERPITNTHGLIKNWVLRYLSFKMDGQAYDTACESDVDLSEFWNTGASV